MEIVTLKFQVPFNNRDRGKVYPIIDVQCEADVFGHLAVHRPYRYEGGTHVQAKSGWQVTELRTGAEQTRFNTKAMCVRYCNEFNALAAERGATIVEAYSTAQQRMSWRISAAYKQLHDEIWLKVQTR